MDDADRVRWMAAARAATVTRGSMLLSVAGMVLAGIVMSALPASACSVPADPSERLGWAERDALEASAADAVVVGTVVGFYDSPPVGQNPATALAVYTVEVDAVLKGTATRLERVVMSSPLNSCGEGGGRLVLGEKMVVFLHAASHPTLGARYDTGSRNGNRAVGSVAAVNFPGAVSASPLPGGSIAMAANTPGGDPTPQSQFPTAAVIALGVAVGAALAARFLQRHRGRWRSSGD